MAERAVCGVNFLIDRGAAAAGAAPAGEHSNICIRTYVCMRMQLSNEYTTRPGSNPSVAQFASNYFFLCVFRRFEFRLQTRTVILKPRPINISKTSYLNLFLYLVRRRQVKTRCGASHWHVLDTKNCVSRPKQKQSDTLRCASESRYSAGIFNGQRGAVKAARIKRHRSDHT